MKELNLTDWVNNYTEEMLSWAVFKVSDPEIAKDLVQDTFLAAAEKTSSFKGKSSPKTWLFSILKFKIIDHYRAKVKTPINTDKDALSLFFDANGEWKHDKRPSDWGVKDSHLLDDYEFKAVLKLCMDALPENWNTCVRLKYLLGKKGSEICEEMEISKNNYWQMIHRAKLNLRDCIESNWFNKL